jgi:hypothetical protein
VQIVRLVFGPVALGVSPKESRALASYLSPRQSYRKLAIARMPHHAHGPVFKTYYLYAEPGAPAHDRPYGGVQPGAIPAAGKDANAFYCHFFSLLFSGYYTRR